MQWSLTATMKVEIYWTLINKMNEYLSQINVHSLIMYDLDTANLVERQVFLRIHYAPVVRIQINSNRWGLRKLHLLALDSINNIYWINLKGIRDFSRLYEVGRIEFSEVVFSAVTIKFSSINFKCFLARKSFIKLLWIFNENNTWNRSTRN